MKHTTKARANKIHAKRRAFERFGLYLNKDDLADIVKIIQGGRAISVKKQTNNRSECELVWEGKKIRVIYCKRTKGIITVLPERKR